MEKINNHVQFDAEMTKQIDSKLKDSQFTHKNWGNSDLENIRCHIRNFYRNEQKGICAYCQGPVSLRSASNCHVEHIAPKSIYPSFIFKEKNFCVACADCNEIKREQETLGEEPDTVVNGAARAQYPRSSSAFKIVHPHFDVYSDHIVIFNGYYVDCSLKGNFTIGACKLNRRLYEFGWEEPLVSEVEISEMMNQYLDSEDSIEKNDKLQKLKRTLITVS